MEDIKVIYRMKLSPANEGEKWVEAIKQGSRCGYRFYRFSSEELAAAAAMNSKDTQAYLPWDKSHSTLLVMRED
jgi:hypothetical protein